MLRPNSATAFTDTLADILRLPDETLATTYIYVNKYKRFHSLHDDQPDVLDGYTLHLSSLSLASKATESLRRMHEILLPAHRLLHPSSSSSPPVPPSKRPQSEAPQQLTIPSPLYDKLRATLIQAESLMLRILGFELRVSTPLEFLERYLHRAVEDVAKVGEDYDAWSGEERSEFGVVGSVLEMRLGRACRGKAVEVCKDYQIANFFPARAVALGCLYLALEKRGLEVGKGEERTKWVERIGGRKVDLEDFEEVVEAIGAMR